MARAEKRLNVPVCVRLAELPSAVARAGIPQVLIAGITSNGYGNCSLRELGQRLRENAMRGSTGRAAGPEAAGTATGALPGRPARAGLAASAAALMGNL